MKKWVILAMLALLLGPASFSEELEREDSLIMAYFVGYDENDIVFHIVNNSVFDIKVKGLSYRSQMLYRPIEKNVIVSPASEKESFQEVKFRTTGDFVWSQNHMNQFRLAYHNLEEKDRSYALLSTKEVTHEE